RSAGRRWRGRALREAVNRSPLRGQGGLPPPAKRWGGLGWGVMRPHEALRLERKRPPPPTPPHRSLRSRGEGGREARRGGSRKARRGESKGTPVRAVTAATHATAAVQPRALKKTQYRPACCLRSPIRIASPRAAARAARSCSPTAAAPISIR